MCAYRHIKSIKNTASMWFFDGRSSNIEIDLLINSEIKYQFNVTKRIDYGIDKAATFQRSSNDKSVRRSRRKARSSAGLAPGGVMQVTCIGGTVFSATKRDWK